MICVVPRIINLSRSHFLWIADCNIIVIGTTPDLANLNQELLAAEPERQQITAIKLSVSRIGGSQIIRPIVLSIQLKNLPKAKMGQRLQELLPQFGKIWE